MPWSLDNLPSSWVNLPEGLQKILISVGNKILKKVGEDNVVQAIFGAWGAAKQKWEKKEGNWVKRKSDCLCSNSTFQDRPVHFIRLRNDDNINIIDEDEYFTHIDKTITTVGVMNGAFKPAVEIRKIPSLLPERYEGALPVFNDHPNDENSENLELAEGFLWNIRCEEYNGKPRIRATEAIPKNQPEVLDGIKLGMGNSIAFYADIEIEEGEYEGRKYNYIEHNITLIHDARMVTMRASCGADQGCGYNADTGDKTMKNELSDRDKRDFFRTLIPKKKDEWVFVLDVYNDFFVYEHEAKEKIQYLKQRYNVDEKDQVMFIDKPIEVTRKIEYIEITGDNMETEIEEIEEVEEESSEEQSESEAVEEPVEEEEEEEDEESEAEPEDEPVEEEDESECDHVQTIENLNKELAEKNMIIESLSVKAKKYDDMIETQLENARAEVKEFFGDKFTEDDIKNMSQEEIERILKIKPDKNFSSKPINAVKGKKTKQILTKTNKIGKVCSYDQDGKAIWQ